MNGPTVYQHPGPGQHYGGVDVDQSTKRCNKCHEKKPLSEFSKLAQSRDGFNYRCRQCERRRFKEYRSKNPDYYKNQKPQKVELERRRREGNKACTSCGLVKSLEDFHLRRGAQDGRMSRCGDCVNAERHTEQQRARYRQRYQRNRDAILEWHRAYHHVNREKRRTKSRRWYEANRHKAKARSSRYRRQYPEKTREANRQRRERVRAAGGNFTGEDVLRKLREQKNRCYWCRSPLKGSYEVDHVIPLIRGGSNTAGNICCTCRSCNRRKSGKMPHEFSDRLF